MAAAHPPVAARGCRVHVRLSVTVCHTHESVPRLQEHFSLRPPPPQSPAVPAPMYRAVSRVRARAAAQAAADNWLGLSFNAAASKGDCGAASEAAMGRRRRRRRRRARARRAAETATAACAPQRSDSTHRACPTLLSGRTCTILRRRQHERLGAVGGQVRGRSNEGAHAVVAVSAAAEPARAAAAARKNFLTRTELYFRCKNRAC